MTSPERKPVTHVALAIDASGSMYHLRYQAIDLVRRTIATLMQLSLQTGQVVQLSLLTFNEHVQIAYVSRDVTDILGLFGYHPAGQTALLDAAGLALSQLDSVRHNPDDAFLLIVITDGEENASLTHTAQSFRRLVEGAEATGQWTIAFQVPPGSRSSVSHRFGIPLGNIREWEATSRGIEEAAELTSAGLGDYLAARAKGDTKTETFYATTDLAKVTEDQLRALLVPQCKRFRVCTVEKECVIKDFVEEKTHKPYVIGSAYYELTKPELVQPQKNVLVVERGKERDVFGGGAARELIGLPVGSAAKLKIGNLSRFRAFIQSTSTNRKLVRGSLVLIDRHKTVSDQPTWAPDPAKGKVRV